MINMLEQSEQEKSGFNWVERMRLQRAKDGQIFRLLFEECGPEYVHSAEQIKWGKTYMTKVMEDLQDTSSLYYDEEYSLEEALEQLKQELKIARKVRNLYFDAKQHAEDNGTIINE